MTLLVTRDDLIMIVASDIEKLVSSSPHPFSLGVVYYEKTKKTERVLEKV